MTRPPPRSTRTYHLFPYTTLFLSAGVVQMVQHAAAVDVIPRARRERARIEQRSAQETDVAEAADLRPLARDRLARLGEVEMHHLAGNAEIGHALPAQDRGIAGAAARHQCPERLRSEERRGGKEWV